MKLINQSGAQPEPSLQLEVLQRLLRIRNYALSCRQENDSQGAHHSKTESGRDPASCSLINQEQLRLSLYRQAYRLSFAGVELTRQQREHRRGRNGDNLYIRQPLAPVAKKLGSLIKLVSHCLGNDQGSEETVEKRMAGSSQEAGDRRCVGYDDHDSQLIQGLKAVLKVASEILRLQVKRNPPLSEEVLKRQTIHLGDLASLRSREQTLSNQEHRELPPQLGLNSPRRQLESGDDIVRNLELDTAHGRPRSA